jgi:hypothetical protein
MIAMAIIKDGICLRESKGKKERDEGCRGEDRRASWRMGLRSAARNRLISARGCSMAIRRLSVSFSYKPIFVDVEPKLTARI